MIEKGRCPHCKVDMTYPKGRHLPITCEACTRLVTKRQFLEAQQLEHAMEVERDGALTAPIEPLPQQSGSPKPETRWVKNPTMDTRPAAPSEATPADFVYDAMRVEEGALMPTSKTYCPPYTAVIEKFDPEATEARFAAVYWKAKFAEGRERIKSGTAISFDGETDIRGTSEDGGIPDTEHGGASEDDTPREHSIRASDDTNGEATA